MVIAARSRPKSSAQLVIHRKRPLELDAIERHTRPERDNNREDAPLPFINLRRGIDIYAHWSGKTAAEERAQINGLSVAHGHVGYLREAYDGEPYATRELVPEAFDG